MESEPALSGNNGVQCCLAWLQLGHRTIPIAHGDAMCSAQALKDDAPLHTGEVYLGDPRRGKVTNFDPELSAALVPSWGTVQDLRARVEESVMDH